MIMFSIRITSQTDRLRIMSAPLDTEDLLGLIIGNFKSYTKVLGADSPAPITVTFQRHEVEE